MNLLEEYIETRKVFCEKKLALEECLEPLIKRKSHLGMDDIYYDIRNWEDDHLVVFVSDPKFTNPKHIWLTKPEIMFELTR